VARCLLLKKILLLILLQKILRLITFKLSGQISEFSQNPEIFGYCAAIDDSPTH